EETPDVQIDGPWFVEPGVPFVVTNDTEGDPTFAWTLDDEPYSTERSPTFTFSTFGVRDIAVTATTSAGCEDDGSVLVKVVSCEPPIPTDATVLTGTSTGNFGGRKRFWVCDGGVL